MAREKFGHLAFPRTLRLQLSRALTLRKKCSRHLCACTSSAQPDKIVPDIHALCTVLGNHDMSASVFVVQFNGFMSLTIYFDVKCRYEVKATI